MLSIEEDLKNAADEYVKTHKDARSFSGLVSLALKEYIHREEKMKDEAKQENIIMMLLEQSLLTGQNMSQEMFETLKQPPTDPSEIHQKLERWRNTMKKQEQIIDFLNTYASNKK